jgi:RNA polymerase sigma-70 factor, ECF subfamily
MMLHLADPNLALTANSSLSDEEVVDRVRAGDTPLYEILMRRHNQRLFRIARAILGNSDEAEDVIQHAYVRAYAALHQFAGRSQFSTWLTKIAVHEASSRLMKRKRIQSVPPSADEEYDGMEAIKSSGANPEEQVLRHETIRLLEEAVDSLPGTYRCVFVLREMENMSTAETANCLELTEEAVKVRLLRARHMLRKELYTRVGATGTRAFEFLGPRCDRVVRSVLDQLIDPQPTA